MFSSRRGKGKSSPSPYNNWEGPVPYYYQSVSAAAASCMKKFRIGAGPDSLEFCMCGNLCTTVDNWLSDQQCDACLCRKSGPSVDASAHKLRTVSRDPCVFAFHNSIR